MRKKGRALIICSVLWAMGLLGPTTARAEKALTLERIPGERVHVYLNKKAAKEGNYPVLEIKARELFAGQILSMNDRELFELLGDGYVIKETNYDEYVFNVVRAGSHDEPFFQLLGGHNRVDRGLTRNPNLKIKVRVLLDVTRFSEDEQKDLLSIYGHFWSPENPEGLYEKLSVHHIVPSPWRSLVKIKWVKNEYASYLDEKLVFPEIEFGRRLYEHLKEQGFQDMELITTAQVEQALKATRPCELALKN